MGLSPKRGMLSTAVDKVRNIFKSALDRVFGLETRGIVTLSELGLERREHQSYSPSSWFTLFKVSRVIPFSRDDVFIDIGAGKGRVVVLAARFFPFKKVIGIELSSELSEVARLNVARNQRKLKCKNVEILTQDALSYEYPEEISIVYLYVPFTGSVFRIVVERIEHLATVRAKKNRNLWVVFQRPLVGDKSAVFSECNQVLKDSPRFEELKTIVSNGNGTTIYRSVQT